MAHSTFRQFCTRMYLDYSDEFSSCGSERLSEKEYIKQYNEWLLKKYAEQVEKRNEFTE